MTSSDIKLNIEEIKLMALFGDITGAEVKDCIVDQDGERIIFVVSPGHLGLAIGRRGTTIKRARTMLKRDIDVVEDADTPETFVRNALAPAKVTTVNVQEQSKGRRVAVVTVKSENRGRVIGRNGRNIERARLLAKRHHGIDTIIIAEASPDTSG
ncbi:MAG: NusA-like transcription termination signal-binding factor [Candidatus Thorarchaeota archaeon]